MGFVLSQLKAIIISESAGAPDACYVAQSRVVPRVRSFAWCVDFQANSSYVQGTVDGRTNYEGRRRSWSIV